MSYLDLGQLSTDVTCEELQGRCESTRVTIGAALREASAMRQQGWELSKSPVPADVAQGAALTERAAELAREAARLESQAEDCWTLWRAQCSVASRAVEGTTAGARVKLPPGKTVTEARIEYEVTQRPAGEPVEVAAARAIALERDPRTSWAVESARFQQAQVQRARALTPGRWTTGAVASLGVVLTVGLFGLWYMRSGS